MYKYLLEMCITFYKEQWYCYWCKSIQSSPERAIYHSKRAHIIPNKISLFVRSMDLLEDECYELLFNGIVIIDPPNTYFCVTCQSTISSINNVYQHLKSIKHKNRKKQEQKDFSNDKKNTNDEKNNKERETSNIAISTKNSNSSKFFTEIKQTSQNGLIKEKTVSFCYLCDMFIYRDVEEHKLKKLHKKLVSKLSHSHLNVNHITLNMNIEHKINRPNAAYSCDICNEEIPHNNIIEHLEKEHKDETFINEHGKINSKLCLFFNCNLCGIILYSTKSLETHFLNVQHTENIKKFIKDTTYDIALAYNELNECTSFSHKCVELFNVIRLKGDLFIDILEEPIIYIQKNKDDATYSCIPCRTSIKGADRFYKHFQKKLHQDNLLIKNNISKSDMCGFKNRSVNLNKSKNHNVHKSQTKQYYNRKFEESNNEISCQDEKTISDLYLPSYIDTEMKWLITRYGYSCQILEKGFNYENKKVLDRHNKMYQQKFLDLERIIFTCNEEKKEWINLNFKFLITYTCNSKKNVYCIICNKTTIASDINTLYEHIHAQSHVTKCKKLQKQRKEFELLKKEYMNNIPGTNYISCYACNVNIYEDKLHIHKQLTGHKKNNEKLLYQANNRYHSILKEFENCWYNIQYFACVMCNKRFFFKIEFMEHLDTKHKEIDTTMNIDFDFCIKCATLWYITERCIEIYGQHCQLQLHMYLTTRNEFAIRPFPSTVKKLLKAVDRNVVKLLKSASDIKADANSKQVVNDLKCILISNNFASTKVLMFGSRYTGLASLNSDIDICIDFGDENIDTELINTRSKQIQSCLHTDPKTWRIEEILLKSRIPLIKSRHNLTGLQCDISFTSSPSVRNSRFISFINTKYPLCRKMILFLKKWMLLCDFPGYNRITNYALTWLVIFFLQIKFKIPSIATLIKESNISEITSDCQIEVPDIFLSDISELLMPELLSCFFDYYKSFDYMNLVICPLLGHTYMKKHFTEIIAVPKEMTSYIEQLQSKNPRYFNIDSVMCVQDPFDLSFNLTKAVSVLTLNHFRHYCKESALILHRK